MRNFIILLTLCFGLSLKAQEVPLSWNKDFNVALELAKQENKSILIYFTKPGCKECLEFYTEELAQSDFKAVADKYVLLMMEGSNNTSKNVGINEIKQRRLVQHYNKTMTFPAMLVVDTNKQEVGTPLTSTDDTSVAQFFDFLKTTK